MKLRNVCLSRDDKRIMASLIRDPDWDRCDSGEAWKLLKLLAAERRAFKRALATTLEIAQHYAPTPHDHSWTDECGGDCSEAAHVWADLHAAHDLLERTQ